MNKIIKSGYVCEGIICESIDVDNKVFYLKQNGINYRYKPDIDIKERLLTLTNNETIFASRQGIKKCFN